MIYLVVKTAISAIIIVMVSEVARRSAGLGALLASLPLVALLSMIWLWRDTGDTARMVSYSQATFWYVLPSLPMFLLIPVLLKRGFAFWPSLAAGCALTIVLYVGMAALLARRDIRLRQRHSQQLRGTSSRPSPRSPVALPSGQSFGSIDRQPGSPPASCH